MAPSNNQGICRQTLPDCLPGTAELRKKLKSRSMITSVTDNEFPFFDDYGCIGSIVSPWGPRRSHMATRRGINIVSHTLALGNARYCKNSVLSINDCRFDLIFQYECFAEMQCCARV